MKKKSIQDLDSDQVKIIYSLIKEGVTLTDIFKITKIPINRHTIKYKSDPDYKSKFDEYKLKGNQFEKYDILNSISDSNMTLKEIESKYSNTLPKIKKDKNFNFLWKLVTGDVYKTNPPILECSKNGRIFSLNKSVVLKICKKCNQGLSPNFFYKNESSKTGKGLDNLCNDCRNKLGNGKKQPGRRGETYKLEKIKKFNSLGNTVDRKCPNCQIFKSFREFSHLYLGIGVCNSCYIDGNNSNLVRKKIEFFKGVQVRKYDVNSMVTHKTCSNCKQMMVVEEFHVSNRNWIDGRCGYCKSCISRR